jgi:hypothetical protein
VERASVINHKGVDIVYLDFSGGDIQAVRDSLKFAEPLIRNNPPKSVYTLTYTDGGKFDRDIINDLKEFTKGNEPYVAAAAVVGIQGLQKIVLDTIKLFTKREFATFDDLETAKDYLAEKASD